MIHASSQYIYGYSHFQNLYYPWRREVISNHLCEKHSEHSRLTSSWRFAGIALRSLFPLICFVFFDSPILPICIAPSPGAENRDMVITIISKLPDIFSWLRWAKILFNLHPDFDAKISLVCFWWTNLQMATEFSVPVGSFNTDEDWTVSFDGIDQRGKTCTSVGDLSDMNEWDVAEW